MVAEIHRAAIIQTHEALPNTDDPKLEVAAGAARYSLLCFLPQDSKQIRSVNVSDWSEEVVGLTKRSEGLGWSGPVDKCEGFRWAGLAQGLSIKLQGLGTLRGRAGPGPVDRSEGLGPGWTANRSEWFWGYGPGPAGPPSLANPHWFNMC